MIPPDELEAFQREAAAGREGAEPLGRQDWVLDKGSCDSVSTRTEGPRQLTTEDK